MAKEYSVLHFKLRAADVYTEVIHRCAKLKTDQERIIFALNLMHEYDIIPSATGMSKNIQESEKWREQGNKIYVKGGHNNETCIEALKLYTISIAFAPYPSEQLALGYANRSAVLFQLGLYLECIQDIDRALALNYPDNLTAKLYVRKAECLIITGHCSVRNIFEEAQHSLDKMSAVNDPIRENLRAKLDDLRNKTVQIELHTITDTKTKTLETSALPTIESYNKRVPCASDAVAVKYNERYGRHVVATRDIRPGEVIAVEKPYSLILSKQNLQTHCSNCLRVCWANIPCNYCTYAMYCSEECRNSQWKKCHDIECTVFPALKEYGVNDGDLFNIRLAILAVREAGSIKELRTMLKEVDEYNDPRTKGFSRDGNLHSGRYIGVCSLLTNTEKRDVSVLLYSSVLVSVILYYLTTRTEIFGVKLAPDLIALAKNNDVTFFGSLILRHQLIFASNTHIFDEVRGTEHVERGIAVTTFISLFNHSCDPNSFRISMLNHIVMYAARPIRKGEQLLDSYGRHFANRSKAERQQELEQYYYFKCDCEPCREDWPLYRELMSYETLVMKSEDKAKIRESLKNLKIYSELLITAFNVRDKPGMIEDLLNMVQVLHDYAPMSCKEMTTVIMVLKWVYAVSGNVYEIPELRK